MPGCSAAAVAVVAGKAPANVCIVADEESTHKVAEIMGIDAGLAEPSRAYNPCSGGDRANDQFIYMGVKYLPRPRQCCMGEKENAVLAALVLAIV